MASHRSQRLSANLMTCSSTPRTCKRYAEQLAKMCADHDEHLYAEAKLALTNGDMKAAHTLLSQCSEDFRNTSKYLEQCATYDRLCEQGLIQRKETDGIRIVLASILGEASKSMVVTRYAESLRKHGFRKGTIGDLNLHTVESAIDCAGMQGGHRVRMIQFAEGKMNPLERALCNATRATKNCLEFLLCAKAAMTTVTETKDMAMALRAGDTIEADE